MTKTENTYLTRDGSSRENPAAATADGRSASIADQHGPIYHISIADVSRLPALACLAGPPPDAAAPIEPKHKPALAHRQRQPAACLIAGAK
jgi:hypothetical protein